MSHSQNWRKTEAAKLLLKNFATSGGIVEKWMQPSFSFAADWLLLWVFHQKSQQTEVDVNSSETEAGGTSELLSQLSNDTMHHQNDLAWNDNVREFFEMRFANLTDYCIPAFCVSYFFFFAIGGYLHVSQKILYDAWQQLCENLTFMGFLEIFFYSSTMQFWNRNA